MSGEDQERFEDYLELEHYIEELQAGRVAHPPAELTPAQANVYRMAALFRSASPEAIEPQPEFVAELRARLEQELQQPKTQKIPVIDVKRRQKKPGIVSRRALLTGSAAAAASLAIGAGIDHALEQTKTPVSPPSHTQLGNLIGDGVATTWLPVTTLAALGKRAIQFVSGTIVGYVIRDDGDDGDPDKGKIIAMSAACTHMGCIVQWQDEDRKFHCPCHGGIFTEYGKVDNGAWGGAVPYLYPLPRLNTKVDEKGNVLVEVPVSWK